MKLNDKWSPSDVKTGYKVAIVTGNKVMWSTGTVSIVIKSTKQKNYENDALSAGKEEGPRILIELFMKEQATNWVTDGHVRGYPDPILASTLAQVHVF